MTLGATGWKSERREENAIALLQETVEFAAPLHRVIQPQARVMSALESVEQEPAATSSPRGAQRYRSAEADRLRVLAMAGVVLLHTAAPNVASFSVTNARWMWANVLDALARPAVPLFFMFTGALALRIDCALEPWAELRKRAFAFWRPAILWMLVYWVWDRWREHKPWNAASAWRTLVLGETHYHLWYVWVAGGLFLALPIVSRWWCSARDEEKRYALILWSALAVVAPWVARIAYGYPQRLDFLVFGGYAGFLVLGGCLASHPPSPRRRRALLVAGVAAYVVTIAGTTWLRHWTIVRATAATVAAGGKRVVPVFDERFYSYLTPNVVLMAVAWWVLFAPRGFAPAVAASDAGAPTPNDGRVRRWLADASYPVYLAHPIVLEALPRLVPGVAPITADARVAPLVASGVLGVSLALVAIGSRIPIVRLLVPMAARRR